MWDFIGYTGVAVFILGGLALLVAAFRTSILWGLGCLIFSPLSLVYIILHWGAAKFPFYVQLFGVFLFLAAVYIPYWSRA